MDCQQNFENLVAEWINPEKEESPQNLTIHRQKQLKMVLDSYGGMFVPIGHFTDRVVNGVSYFKSGRCPVCGGETKESVQKQHLLRNSEAFPVVYAYLCGLLVRDGDRLSLENGIELGKDDIPRHNHIPSEVQHLYDASVKGANCSELK